MEILALLGYISNTNNKKVFGIFVSCIIMQIKNKSHYTVTISINSLRRSIHTNRTNTTIMFKCS